MTLVASDRPERYRGKARKKQALVVIEAARELGKFAGPDRSWARAL